MKETTKTPADAEAAATSRNSARAEAASRRVHQVADRTPRAK